MIRLLAIDIDGTLLDSRGQIPPAHQHALTATAAAGVEIALVTGRSYHFTRHVIDALGVPVTAIVNNGAVVKNAEGASVMRQILGRDTARRLLHEMRAYEDSVAVVFDRFALDDARQIVFERMDWTHPHRKGYYARNKPFIADAGGPLEAALIDDPIQVMFNGSVEPMRRLYGTVRALPFAGQFSVAITEYVDRDFSLVDVNGPGCSKGTMLARWVASRGWTAAEVMAVGDNLNDVEMLDFAGTAVVMGNAADVVKSRGYLVTSGNDENGLAIAIDRYLRRDA